MLLHETKGLRHVSALCPLPRRIYVTDVLNPSDATKAIQQVDFTPFDKTPLDYSIKMRIKTRPRNTFCFISRRREE